MKKLLVSLCCSISISIAHAQQNYVPGTITTPQHDTLKGFIDFRNWSSSPAEIRFRPTLDGQTTTFTPAQASAFRMYFNGETVYVTKHVLLDITHMITSSTDVTVQTPTTELLDSTLFIQQLVEGAVSLYTFRDKYDRQHFMYGLPGEEPLELKYTRTMIAGEYGGKLYESRDYQQQLLELFQDNAVLAKKAKKVEYDEDKMIALFSAYNQQKQPGHSVGVNTRTKHPVYIGVVGGPSFNKFQWTGGGGSHLSGNYKSTVGFVAGIFADFPFHSEATRKFSINTELLYRSISTEGHVTGRNTAFFKFSYLQANVMGKYTYPKGLVRPFANLGVGVGRIIGTAKNDLYDQRFIGHSKAVEEPRNYEPAFIAGIGVRVDRFQLEARGIRSSGWVPFMDYSLQVQSFQIIAGVRLK